MKKSFWSTRVKWMAMCHCRWIVQQHYSFKVSLKSIYVSWVCELDHISHRPNKSVGRYVLLLTTWMNSKKKQDIWYFYWRADLKKWLSLHSLTRDRRHWLSSLRLCAFMSWYRCNARSMSPAPWHAINICVFTWECIQQSTEKKSSWLFSMVVEGYQGLCLCLHSIIIPTILLTWL